MESCNFEQANRSLGPPKGETEDTVRTLRVMLGHFPDGAMFNLSCWKPTQEEIDEIQRTGRLWLYVLGERMPPVSLLAKSPFEKDLV